MLYGIAYGAALAAVVVLIEEPVMLLLVKICLRTQHRFRAEEKEGGKALEAVEAIDSKDTF